MKFCCTETCEIWPGECLWVWTDIGSVADSEGVLDEGCKSCVILCPEKKCTVCIGCNKYSPKSNSYDAEAVALVLINKLDTLPEPIPDDVYWTLSQLMRRRDTIKRHQIWLKNQQHEQLCVVYPSYKKFFSDISRQTALYFFQKYPSPDYLSSKTTEELAEELRVPSHNNCSTKKCSKILELIASDGVTRREYQSARDAITRSIISDLQHYNDQLASVEEAVKELYPIFECTLMSVPGIDLIMACKLLAEIGDIQRFPNANKLAKFAGVAPVTFSSAGKGSNLPSKQGNLRLPCNPDDSSIAQGYGKKRNLSGVLCKTFSKRKE